MIVLTAPLIAYGLMQEKSLATLPHALVIVGTALLTLPASFLMRRFGRRYGFAIGALIGSGGGVICVFAILMVDFGLFCFPIRENPGSISKNFPVNSPPK